MKKILLVGVLVFTMVIGAFAVYADSPVASGFRRGYGHMGGNAYGNMNDNGFNRRINLTEEEREERIKLALQEGTITEVQAAERRVNFVEMDRFHEENEFIGRGLHGGGMSRGYGQSMIGGCGF